VRRGHRGGQIPDAARMRAFLSGLFPSSTLCSPKALLACRARLYELLVNCIPADVIMKRLAFMLVEGRGAHMPDSLKHDICIWATHYEHRLQLGNKEIFHLEAFVAKAMLLIKSCPPGSAGASSAASKSAATAGGLGGGGAASHAAAMVDSTALMTDDTGEL
jgi:hypothetical protein